MYMYYDRMGDGQNLPDKTPRTKIPAN